MKTRLILFLLLLGFSSYGQWVPLSKELKTKNGNDTVQSKFIIADHLGVIWIGSNEGLTKFTTDKQYEPIRFPQKITCATSIDSTLWIGAGDGSVFIFNTITREIVETIQISDSSSISSIFKSGKKIAFSTFGEGVYLWENNSKIQYSEPTILSDNHVYEAKLINDKLIIASDRGIDIVDVLEAKKLHSLPSSITTSLVYTDSAIIAGSYRYGLLKLNLNDTLLSIPADQYGQQSAIKIKKYENRVFVLAENGIREIIQIDVLSARSILSKSNIIDFEVADEGVMLALCRDGSIVLVDLRIAKAANQIITNSTALAQNSWQIFTAGEGVLQIWDLNSGYPVKEIVLEGEPTVVSMATTEKELFVGTFNQGIYKYRFADGDITKITTSDGLPDNNVLSMSIKEDTLWFTTLSGVSSLSPSGDVHNYPTPEDATYIYSIFTNDTTILIGTDGNGVYELVGDSFAKVPFADKVKNETIYDISKDGDGNLWFITKNGNIFRYASTTNHFSAINLISDDYVMARGGFGNSAFAVGNGWIMTYSENRVITIENSEITDLLSGEYINNISFDGYKNIRFTSGHQLYSFSSEFLDSYPRVLLESFKTNLAETSVVKDDLGSDITHISYTFEPIWYQNQENVRFRFKLVGIDEEWNYSTGNTAVYPNMKYGTYTFQVETGLGKHYYSESRIEHTFQISKPFYLKWWFIAIILLFVFLIIYGFSRWQIARVNRKWLSEKKLVESELAVLRNQVNPHFLFNSLNTLMNLIETKPKAAEDYLQRLSQFYRKILENQDDQVISLRSEYENIEEYIYLQKQRFGEALVLENRINQEIMGTKIPALTLQLLAENAIKHNVVSNSKPLTIKIYNTQQHIVITNNLAPLTGEVSGTGTGLKNIRSRYKMLFKKPVEINNDSINFTIKLPIIF